MAFAALGALIAGEAASATLVLGAMAEVGTAMTVVGAVTGSKSLMQIGGAIGLVGGIGGLVNGAMSGAAGAVGADAGNVAQETFRASEIGAENAASTVGSSAADAVTQGMSQGSVDGVMNTAGGTGQDFGLAVSEAQSSLAGMPEPAFNAAKDSQAFNDIAGKPATDSIVQSVQGGPATPSAPTGAQAPQGATAPQTPADTGVPDAMNRAKDSQAYNQIAGIGPDGSKSYFSKILDWAKQNQALANGALQLGGGLLKGVGEASMVDKKLAQQQQQFNTLYGHANEVASYRPMGIVQSARA